jgi:hypothetical protein
MPLAATPHDLRSHILDGPAEAVRAVLSAAELLGESKVSQHDVTFRVQEDVLQLDITIDDAQLMEKTEIFYLPLNHCNSRRLAGAGCE